MFKHQKSAVHQSALKEFSFIYEMDAEKKHSKHHPVVLEVNI
jgi:hypothetical protein